jgi:hypothetical protein
MSSAWDLTNNLNWDLVLRNIYQATPNPNTRSGFHPIPPVTVTVDSQVLLIGARNGFAKPHWFLAGMAYSRLFFSPSSTSEFLGIVQSQSGIQLGLDRFTLVHFKDFHISPYLLEIRIPKWHEEMLLEIWKYSGAVEDIQSDLSRIEAKIDAINPSVNDFPPGSIGIF